MKPITVYQYEPIDMKVGMNVSTRDCAGKVVSWDDHHVVFRVTPLLQPPHDWHARYEELYCPGPKL